MKIAIEAQRIFRTNKHGMDFVALESIRELQKLDHENEYFIFVTPGEDRCLEESENVHIIELKCPTYPLWEQVALPRAVKKIRPDLLHCTSNTAPLQCPVPLILTLHDIIYLEKRHSSSFTWYQEMGWFYRRMVVPRVLANCEKIITVSQFERERILDVLHLPEEQLVAVYNGFNSHFHVQPKAPEITRKYIDADNYLFFLGNTDPKKNTPRVLKAYSDYLKQSTQKLPLLIADLKGDVIDQILEEENIREIKSYIHAPGYIANTDLAVHSHSFIHRFARVSASRCWRQWLAERPSLRETHQPCPKLQARELYWQIRSTPMILQKKYCNWKMTRHSISNKWNMAYNAASCFHGGIRQNRC